MGNTLAFSAPGFWELAALCLLALLIFGPDRLPGMARSAGRTLTQFKREAASTLDELKRTADLDELRGVADELRSTGEELRSTGQELHSTGEELHRTAVSSGRAPAITSLEPGGQAAEAGTPAPFDPDAP